MSRSLSALLVSVLVLSACSSAAEPEVVSDPTPVPVNERPGLEGPSVEEVVVDASPPELLVPAPAVEVTTAPDALPAGERRGALTPEDSGSESDTQPGTGGAEANDTTTPDTTDIADPAEGPESIDPADAAEADEVELPDNTAGGSSDEPAVGSLPDISADPSTAQTNPAGEAPSTEAEAVDAEGDEPGGGGTEVRPFEGVPVDPGVTDPIEDDTAEVTTAVHAGAYADPWEDLFASLGSAVAFPAPTTDAPAGVGVTDQMIEIQGLVSQTLVGTQINAGVCAGAQARYTQANVDQELSRLINFSACHDDASRVELSAGIVRATAAADVFAVAPVSSQAFLADAILNEAHVPYVGSGALPGFCGSQASYGFGVGGARGCPILPSRGYLVLTTPVLTAWAGSQTPGQDLGTIAHVVEASAQGADVRQARSFEAALLGLDLAPLNIVPPASASPIVAWDALATEVLAVDPDRILLEAADALPLVPALRAAGFNGEIAWVGVIDPLELADVQTRASLAPLTVISPGVDLSATASETWARMEAGAELIGYTGEVAFEVVADPNLEQAKSLVEAAEAARAEAEAEEAADIEGSATAEGTEAEAAEQAATADTQVIADDRLVGAGFVEGYIAADFVVQALAATPEPLTREAFHDLINGGWWYPGLADVACGGWWPTSHYLEVPCVSVSYVDAFSPELVPVLGLREVAPRWQGSLGE